MQGRRSQHLGRKKKNGIETQTVKMKELELQERMKEHESVTLEEEGGGGG